MMSMEILDEKAEKTLRETDTFRVPVPIHLLAQRLNLGTEALSLGALSGILVVKGDRGAIGYNSAHARVRQRFTVSHEIAHYILHTERTEKARLFIDKHLLFQPDENPVSADVRRENTEANRFASALLMPKEFVLKEIQNGDLNLDDEEAIKHLAKYFWVSSAIMANRLLNLRLLLYPVAHEV